MMGMINCKEATYLVSKKEEGKIRVGERIKLSFHTIMCRFCKMFEIQNNYIAHHSRRLEDVLSPGEEDVLPATLKEHIKTTISG